MLDPGPQNNASRGGLLQPVGGLHGGYEGDGLDFVLGLCLENGAE